MTHIINNNDIVSSSLRKWEILYSGHFIIRLCFDYIMIMTAIWAFIFIWIKICISCTIWYIFSVYFYRDQQHMVYILGVVVMGIVSVLCYSTLHK